MTSKTEFREGRIFHESETLVSDRANDSPVLVLQMGVDIFLI